MNELMKFEKCEVSATGLKLDENLSFDEWKEIGLKLQTMHGSVGFWIGDWWNFGDRKYGEMATQAVEFGINYETFKQYVWLSKKMPLCTRVHNLGFTAHREIASLPDERQQELLEKASQENLTTREIRDLVREIKSPAQTVEVTDTDRNYSEVANAITELSLALNQNPLSTINEAERGRVVEKLRHLAQQIMQYVNNGKNQEPITINE